MVGYGVGAAFGVCVRVPSCDAVRFEDPLLELPFDEDTTAYAMPAVLTESKDIPSIDMQMACVFALANINMINVSCKHVA